MNGAMTVVTFLEEKGVPFAFGYPGGPILDIYDAIYKRKFNHILTRHEQGAVHAAEGYAKLTGKPGVVIATSGPGATNLVTGLADAFLDSVPIFAITGAVARDSIGKDAFQEADITGITQPITKYSYLVMSPEDLYPTLEEAWKLTTEGRNGPVLVNIPKDILSMEIACKLPTGHGKIMHRPQRKKADNQVENVYHAIWQAKRPLMIIGGGLVLSENAPSLMREFTEKTGIPVAFTMMGKGGIDEKHENSLGLIGMHGTPQADKALDEADLLLAVGCRFSDRMIGNPDRYMDDREQVVIHVDIDPAEISKNIHANIEIEDDAANFFTCMLSGFPKKSLPKAWQIWREKLFAIREEYALDNAKHYPLDDSLFPQAVVREISKLYKNDNPILVTDVGQNQLYATQHFRVSSPRSFLTSGGLGTMGVGLPFGIGAALAEKSRPVVVFVGDGGFQMTIQELGTLCEQHLPLKIIILDNQSLGMIHQLQKVFCKQRYSASAMLANPDFCTIAKAYGIDGMKVTNKEELLKGAKALHDAKGPFVLHVLTNADMMVYPMIPAGKNPEDILLFDDER
ncbi:MAG TPA: biosynthetic-type acetolactate synthase large subunit [Bacillota bacterium]|nr:biosynthetic-type acetolactate synthase large subunit [Bacillota bacterium]HPE38602.1 biosynthetic-type acetolactate synthase large subunit [Bacillota bacterium]